ncbi:MAG: hypothetical protein ACOYUB_00970 [Patescibacteria group bacterium]
MLEDSFAWVAAANAAGMKTVNKSIVNFRDIENTLSGLSGSPASTAAF